MTTNIKNKTISAIKWVSAMQVTNIAGQLIVRLILASILFPDEIGLIAIITVITETLVIAADMGFNASVIQRKNLTDKHVSTAFFVNMAFGILLCFLIFITAGSVSSFFNDVRLEELLQIISVVVIIRASVSVQIGLCDRELNFKKIVIATLIGLMISSVVKIVLAKKGFGAKSIVYGDIIHHSIIAAFLWLSTGFLPSFKKFSRKAFKDLFSFGGNIMLVNSINHLSTRVDVIIVGKILGTFAAGILSIAVMISNMLVSVMNNIIQRVIFPSFSRLQDDNTKIRTAYVQLTKYLSLLGIPICVGIIFTVPEFISIFLNESWKDAIPIVQILAFASMFNSMGGILWGQVLKAKGMSKLILLLTVIRLFVLSGFILIGANFGLKGIALAIVVYSGTFRFVYQHIVNKIINLSMIQYLKSLIPAIVNAIIMSALLFVIKYFLLNYDVSDIVVLIVLALLGFVIYSLSFVLFFKPDLKEAINIVQSRYKNNNNEKT